MALKLSKHCRKRYTYGICIQCDECGYMTRRDMYNDVNKSSHQLYKNSKKGIKKAEDFFNDIYKLDSNCKEIMQMIKEKNAKDGNMKEFSSKVRLLSKIAKMLSMLLEEFMELIEEVEKLSDTIENKIDFK